MTSIANADNDIRGGKRNSSSSIVAWNFTQAQLQILKLVLQEVAGMENSIAMHWKQFVDAILVVNALW